MVTFKNILSFEEIDNANDLIKSYSLDIELFEEYSKNDIELELTETFFQKFFNKMIKSKKYTFEFNEWLINELENDFFIEYDDDNSFIFNCFLDELFEYNIENKDELIEYIVEYYEHL